MKIAFITAMPEEFRAVCCHLDASSTHRIGSYRARTGTVSGHDVVVIESGMGFDNAAKATQALFGTMRPDILISAGFCGGITPDLAVGAVVVATRLAIVSVNKVDELPIELAAAGYNFVARESMTSQHVLGGMFVSTPGIMAKFRIVSLLPTGTLHPVVEMESAAIAKVAAKNGVPFIGIRSVSDPANEELGFSLDEFCDNRMRIRFSRILLTIIRKPRIIPQLIRLARNSKIAGASLAGAVEKFLNFV